ncbi:MAG: glycosyltransferase [Candidatus Eremiobacteraeota bacterium]|nr:glycosyltransferase [Candidatus Eremiobacteraeota bacterium]
MRALLVLRPDALTHHGGDTVQAHSTASALCAIGLEAHVVATKSPDPRGFDIAHIFGMNQPEVCARQIECCRRAGVSVALSPIWLSLREFFARARAVEAVLGKARAEKAARAKLARLRATPAVRLLDRRRHAQLARMEALQVRLLLAADVLLPNSAIEAREYVTALGVTCARVRVVRNAVVDQAYDGTPAARAGVLCAGRVESMKNQAMLALAVRGLDPSLTLAGEACDSYYLQLCRRWGGSQLQHAGRLAQPQLFAALRATQVHAMPSWGETTGLASLEAAAAGCKLVVGNRGAEIEYFGDDAEYADPADPDSIRAAVLRALGRPPRAAGDSLDRRMRALSWRRAAEQTAAAYGWALSGSASAANPSAGVPPTGGRR